MRGPSRDTFPKTLVFCKTKAQCVKVYMLLSSMSSHRGLVSMYHATLSEETKEFLYRHFSAFKNPAMGQVVQCHAFSVFDS